MRRYGLHVDVEPDTRVCPRCGEVAAENEYCSTCGLHLFEQAELPTRRQWEERKTSAEPQAALPPTAHEPVGFQPRRLVPLLAVLAAVAVVSVGATILSGGEDSNPEVSRDESSDVDVDPGPTVAEECIGRWNLGATANAKRMIGGFARSLRGQAAPTYVDADLDADLPDRCLITVAQPDLGQAGVVVQFLEKSGGVFDFPAGGTGSIPELPASSKAWNAQGDADGYLSIGSP